MDGDIDIEEHDILGNPQISNIFPDLSKIKSEFTDDDVTIVEHSPDLEIKQEVDYVDEHQECDAVCKTGFNNTINKNASEVAIGIQNSGGINNHTALSSNTLNISRRTSIVKTSDSLENAAQIIKNTQSVVKKLGGNSNNSAVTTIMRKSMASKLVLKENKVSNSVDMQSGSSKFRNYIIIGGTNSDKPKVPSPNVKIMSNKIILGSKAPPVKSKEYLPAVVVLKDCRTVLKASSRFCDSCKILFPTKNGLDAHNTSTHSASIELTGNAVVDIESDNDSEIMEFKGNIQYSFYCGKPVKSVNTKNMEMNKCVNKRKLSDQDEESINSAKRFRNAAKNIKNIQNSISNFDGTITGEKCYHCYKVFENNSELIKHLYSLLLDKNDSNDVAKVKNTGPKSIFKCQICNETFPNETVANFHKRFLHPNQSGNIIESSNVNIQKKQTISNNKTALIKKNKLFDTNALVAKNVVMKKQNVEFQFRSGVLIKNPPIPIGAVFKCSKCDLHFIVAHTARNHSKLCKNLIKQYECKKCQRKFKLCDLKMHELQHLVTSSFKAYVIQKNLLQRLLCRCPRCNICFSEGLFAMHLLNPCVKKFIHCKTCNLNINTETYVNTCHENCGTYIIIDYFDNVQKSTVKSICAKESVKERKKKIYRLWYCETCEMCGRNDIRNHNCNPIVKRLCYSCGLYFSPKRIDTHKTMHSKEPLSLHSFLVFSLEKQKYIQPPMPRYKVCTTCKMYYLKWHTSCFKSYKICDFCSKKFEEEHYDMHKNFHTYNLDDLINITIRNGGYVGFKPSLYIYQCVQCICFVNNYDQAVRHSKNHITRTRQEKVYCNVCGNTFDTYSFKGHEHNITRYKILKFNHDKLLSDAWFDMFDGLDQIEISTILMDSMFKDTRSLDLTLVQKGDPEKTLYVCSSCNIVIDKTAIEKHVLNKLCMSRNQRNGCDICDLNFFSVDNMETHTNLHSTGVKKEYFRIISITKNNSEHVAAAALKDYKDDEPVKLSIKDALQRRSCGKGDRSNREIFDVNESSVDSETAYDDKQFEIRGTNSNKPEKCSNNNIKEVNLYKCMNCKACIFPTKYFGNHFCSGYSIRFCDSCKQFYYKSSWAKHSLLIHSDSDPKNISFKFKCFQMKINSAGRRRPCVIKVESKLYDKSKVKIKTGLHNNSTATVKEFTEINTDFSDDKDSGSDNKSEVSEEEYDETNEISLNKTKDKVQNEIPKNNKQIMNIHTDKKFSKRYKKSTIKIKETDKNITSDEDSQGNVTNNVDNNGVHSLSLAKSDDLTRLVIRNNGETKDVILFKCINCKICVFRHKTIRRHTCTIEFYNKFCNTCEQWFSIHNWDLHNIIHESNEKINIRIKYFKPKTIAYSKRTMKRKHILKANAINSIIDDSNLIADKDEENIIKLSHTQAYEKLIATDKKDIVMYKCKHCLICTKKIMKNHRCLIDNFKKFCGICEQYFTALHFSRHVKWHQEYGEFNLIIKHYNPMKKSRENQKDSFSAKNYETSNQKTLREDICSNDEMYEPDDSDIKDEISVPEDNSNDSNNRQRRDLKLFKCLDCSVCHLTTSSIYRHVCVSDLDKRFCEICQQSFVSNNWNAHNTIHISHKKNKIIIIYFESNAKLSSRPYKHSLISNKEFYNLYPCVECGLYYLNIKSLDSHIVNSNHKIVREPKVCTYCELKFASFSFKRHITKCPIKLKRGYIRIMEYYKATMKIRELDMGIDEKAAREESSSAPKNKSRLVKIRKLSEKNSNETYLADHSIVNVASTRNLRNTKVYVNKRKSSNKVYLESSHNSTTNMSNIDSRDAGNNRTEGLELINENEDGTKNPVNAKSDFDVIDPKHAKASNSKACTVKEISENNSTVMSDETKLYSCGECGVYFLKAECCQAHMINHVKLNTREYIKCKLCRLQFLILDLHKHMLTHHENELKFKDVFVEEFMPNENEPRNYKLKDKLQSLVISTTSIEID